MSDQKPGLGLFINKAKKPASSTAGVAPPLNGGAPKDVKKRWLYIGIGVIGVVAVSSSLFSKKNDTVAPVKKQQAAMVSVTPPNADKEAFESKWSKDVESVKQEQERMKQELEAKSREIAALKTAKPIDVPAGIVPPPSAPGANTGGLSSISTPPAPPAPPVPPRVAVPSAPVSAPPPLAGVPPTAPPSLGLPAAPSDVNPLVFDAPERAGAKDAGSKLPSAAAKTRYQKNEHAGTLPAGAFAPLSLLNGIDAGTSTATQNNPMPILANLTDQATLPGAAKYRLKNCFVLGTAYGDMSAERVYARFSRLSCVDKSDRLVLSQEIQGYLVDSDGKLGLRGMIADRQGAKLGKALLAGFAQGLAGALGNAQGSVLQNATTGMTTSSLTGAGAARAAGLTGAQTATSQLAEFYLKEAQAIFPVITVDAGRTGTIVFSSTAVLSWADSENRFVQQVTPVNN